MMRFWKKLAALLLAAASCACSLERCAIGYRTVPGMDGTVEELPVYRAGGCGEISATK